MMNEDEDEIKFQGNPAAFGFGGRTPPKNKDDVRIDSMEEAITRQPDAIA